MEEPPSKVTKFEMESQYLEGEVMEEGQEEWLSEGILTDEDYNPASQQTEPDHSDSNINNSHDETMASMEDQSQEGQISQDVSQNVIQDAIEEVSQDASQEVSQDVNQTEATKNAVSDIEEALNSFEKWERKNMDNDLPDELNTFLIRKKDGKVLATPESDVEGSPKQSDGDGNDTDDLLRVLGDGDQRKGKREEKKETDNREDDTDDDDTYIFDGTKSNTYTVAKSALMRASPKRAEPEDDDVTDYTTDEGDTVEKMFGVKKQSVKPATSKPPAKPAANAEPKQVVVSVKMAEQARRIVKRNVQPRSSVQPRQKPAVKQYLNKRVLGSVVKSRTSSSTRKHSSNISTDKDAMEDRNELDDFTARAPVSKQPKQHLMRPEQMDEEILTDPESDSEDDSMYDELPTSDSDNVDDWFTLDIRAERAGDYIPLLGDKAHQLLLEEKRRVRSRLDDLRQNMSALGKSAKDQADKLREATTAVAELDTLLSTA